MQQNRIINAIIANNAIFKFGDAFFYIGILWAMLGSGAEGLIYVGIIGFLEASVNFLQIPFSTLIEKNEKKRIFLVVTLTRIMTVLLTIGLFFINAPFYLIAICYFFHEITSALISANIQAYTPQVLTAENYKIFQIKASVVQQVIAVVSLLLAGALYIVIGIYGMLAVEFTVVSIFLLITLMSYPKLAANAKTGEQKHLVMLKEGFNYVMQKQQLLTIIAIGMICNSLFAPILQIIIPKIWLIENSSNVSIYTSLSNVLILAGMAVMSLVLIKNEKLRNKNQWFITGGLLLAIPFLLGLIQAIPNVIFVTALIFGAGTTLINNAVTFLFVEHTENEYLARVGAILSTCVQGSVAISIPLAAIIVNSTSYQLYVFIVAVIFFVIALGNQLFLKSNSTEKLNECTQEV